MNLPPRLVDTLTWVAHHEVTMKTAECLPYLISPRFVRAATLVSALNLGAEVTHRGLLCERCIAEFPLDGAERAARGRSLLRAAHISPAWAGVSLAVDVAALLTRRSGRPRSARVLASVGVAATVARALIDQHHRMLEPWCPWCHPGGDSDEDVTDPIPTPTGAGQT